MSGGWWILIERSTDLQLYSTLLYFRLPHYRSLYYNAVLYTTMQYKALDCTVVPCTALDIAFNCNLGKSDAPHFLPSVTPSHPSSSPPFKRWHRGPAEKERNCLWTACHQDCCFSIHGFSWHCSSDHVIFLCRNININIFFRHCSRYNLLLTIPYCDFCSSWHCNCLFLYMHTSDVHLTWIINERRHWLTLIWPVQFWCCA